MKKTILTTLSLIVATAGFSQILTPVKWSYASKKIDNQKAIVFVKATIDKGWHIYSQQLAEGGPVKTSLTFTRNDAYALTGTTTEPKAVNKFEKAFGINVQYFEHAVVFQQKILLKTGQGTITGKINYMACNDKQCLPPEDVEFSIPVK